MQSIVFFFYLKMQTRLPIHQQYTNNDDDHQTKYSENTRRRRLWLSINNDYCAKQNKNK